MKIPCKYERLEDCSKEDLINKIMVRDKHCCDLKELLDKGLKKYKELEEENRKLKEDNRFLTKISKEYMEKENIVEVTEFTELYKDDLEQENKTLKEEKLELKSELSKFRDSFKKYRDYEKEELAESCYDLERENKKLKEERDFFKEQAILWRKDYKNEYEKNIKLEEKLGKLVMKE